MIVRGWNYLKHKRLLPIECFQLSTKSYGTRLHQVRVRATVFKWDITIHVTRLNWKPSVTSDTFFSKCLSCDLLAVPVRVGGMGREWNMKSAERSFVLRGHTSSVWGHSRVDRLMCVGTNTQANCRAYWKWRWSQGSFDTTHSSAGKYSDHTSFLFPHQAAWQYTLNYSNLSS